MVFGACMDYLSSYILGIKSIGHKIHFGISN
jgi:hypothetical protein